MPLGYPAPPAKPAANQSVAPSWISGPNAKKEIAKGRLYRPSWDSPNGPGPPPPNPAGVMAGLWDKDLPDADRHDMLRNLILGMPRYEGDPLSTPFDLVADHKKIDEIEDNAALEQIAEVGLRTLLETHEKENNGSWPDGASELRGGYFMGVVDGCQRQLEAARRVLRHAETMRAGALSEKEAVDALEPKYTHWKVDNVEKEEAAIRASAAEPAASASSKAGKRAASVGATAAREKMRAMLEEAERRQAGSHAAEEEEEPGSAEDAELWRQQMADAFAAGNMDLDELADVSSLDTLLKLLTWPAMRVPVAKTVTAIAEAAEELPDDEVWLQLLRAASEVGAACSGRAEQGAVAELNGSLVGWRERCGADTAEQEKLRRRLRVLVSQGSSASGDQDEQEEPDEEELSEEDAELQRSQMVEAFESGNLDLAALDLSGLPTFFKMLNIPALQAAACSRIAELAKGAAALPPRGQWTRLMGALLAVDEAGGSVESLSAMREAVALAERNQPVGRTPLHLAASLGHVAVVRALLGGQADASLRDNDGLDAQALAAAAGHSEVVELLSAHAQREGDGPSATAQSFPALLNAVCRGDVPGLVSGLLRAPTAIHGSDATGLSLLHWAVSSGHEEIATLLLQRGCDPSRPSNDDQTPLHCAKGEALAALLLKWGADPTIRDTHGRTAAQALRSISAPSPDEPAQPAEEQADAEEPDTGSEEQTEQEKELAQHRQRVMWANSFDGLAQDAVLERQEKKARAAGRVEEAERLVQQRNAMQWRRQGQGRTSQRQNQRQRRPNRDQRPPPQERVFKEEDVDRLWSDAKRAGAALDDDEMRLFLAEDELRRGKSPLGQQRPAQHLFDAVTDAQSRRDLRHRISGRAHRVVQEVLHSSGSASAKMRTLVEAELAEAEAAVAPAQAAVEEAIARARTKPDGADDDPAAARRQRDEKRAQVSEARGMVATAERRLARMRRVMERVEPRRLPSGSDMTEDEIRRAWRGAADESVLLAFFRKHDRSRAGSGRDKGGNIDRTIRHYRSKYRGEDWRKKMYKAAKKRYGVDPRVFWLEAEAEKAKAPKPGPGSTGKRRRADPAKLAAAAAIDRFVAKAEAEVVEHAARVERLEAAVAPAQQAIGAAQERLAEAERQVSAATEGMAADPPTANPLQLRFLQEDVREAAAEVARAEKNAKDRAQLVAKEREWKPAWEWQQRDE